LDQAWYPAVILGHINSGDETKVSLKYVEDDVEETIVLREHQFRLAEAADDSVDNVDSAKEEEEEEEGQEEWQEKEKEEIKPSDDKSSDDESPDEIPWQTTGHEWIGVRVRRFFGVDAVDSDKGPPAGSTSFTDGVIEKWVPEDVDKDEEVGRVSGSCSRVWCACIHK
jgi:hypothetical protein